MSDVVFILGAGASVHAGAPIMSNFLDVAKDLYLKKNVGNKTKEFEQVFRALGELQLVHSKARLDLNNVESVFSIFDLARTVRRLPGHEPSEIDDASRALRWLIVKTLEMSISMDVSGGEVTGTSEYGRLAELIKKLRERSPALNSSVITFNYDTAIDISFAAKNQKFTYALDSNETGIALLKLHGSLNWVKDQSSGAVLPFSIQELIAKHRFSTREPQCLEVAESTINTFRHGKGIKIEDEPVIVPPTWSKGEYHRSIANVWQRAAIELSQARYIFVIGYSLPETDHFFRLLFALGTTGPTLLAKVIVFDPFVAPVEARFRAMLGEGALSRFMARAEVFGAALSSIPGLIG